jgi:hypothetical protein
VSHPDLFHLYLWLSPPPSRCRLSSPLSTVYLYLCSLFVCCQFILFVKSTSGFVSQLLLFPVSLLLAPPGFDPCLSWDRLPDDSVWPWARLPTCTFAPPLDSWPLPTLSLPAVRYCCPTSGLLIPACLDLSIAWPLLDY